MAVTIKQIAEMTGVSRGTVDRVLNDRGNVNPETEERIRKVAAELGYSPNRAGRALAAKKKKYRIGVILCSEGIEFFDEVLHGLSGMEKEASDYGVSIVVRTMRGYSVIQQLDIIEELSQECNLLILNVINDVRIAAAIDKLYERGIAVITINTDIEGTKRLCYVGSDYVRSGATAAGVLGLITGGKGTIAIAGGSESILGHLKRIEGFRDELAEHFPEERIAELFYTEDNDEMAQREMDRVLREHPEITAVYISAAGQIGVCRAISESGRNDICVVSCDRTPSVEKLVKEDRIRATICQQPFTQGKRAVELALQYLINGIVPEKERYIMKNEIRIRENIE